ncbi:hypothetical protein ASG32_31190 [Methylobacterium sp. Leaf361]|uniref:hypothetical protein n=1 Tax=Methylobacterium sp. Leaf361 TaxID=1736352 RepID=UPI0006FF77FB|nr:hypothetical protein [Methylobacterium sp. Leaf361]KQS64025.1 hypothetical protein ASG32_31190 [Methylobacterium sp. Leaf361]
MSLRMSIKKLIRRDPTASLRDRAADLRASLSRRTVVAGTVAVAVPLPALALAPSPAPQVQPHPDQDLFDIEALCARADDAEKAAGAAHGAAYAAFRAALGPFPPELLMTSWEAQTFSPFYGVRASRRLPIRLVHHDDRLNPDFGWTGEALQRAIGTAVNLLGRGGQTPHMIRRWRSLLPAAAAYDARYDELRRQFRIQALADEYEDARKTAGRAHGLLRRTPAKTVEGLAVHTRALASTTWYEGGSPYTILLQSAAAITGVALRQPDFDVPAWLSAWEAAGGRVEYRAERAEWAFIHPSTDGASLETRDRIRGLYNEKSSNSCAIHLWLEPRAADPRFARA